jgi:hypothetical protein
MLRPGAFLSRTAVRLALEAAIIVVAAVAIAFNDPTIGRVIAVMVPTYLLVAGAEWFISKRLREGEAEQAPEPAAPPPAPQPEHVRIVSPTQAPETVEPPVPAAVEATPAEATPEPAIPEPPEPAEEEAPEPVPELVPVGASADGAPASAPEVAQPVPEPEPQRPPLVAVPAPVAVAEPPAEVAVATEPSEPDDETVVQFPSLGPRAWNLWDLERLSRQYAGRDSLRDEERAYLLVYLREFANADGELPVDFDGLVRESFGDLVTTG